MPESPPAEGPTPFDDGALYDVVAGDALDYGRDFYVGLAKEAPGPDVPPELTAEFKRPLQFITPNLLTLAMLIVLFLMVTKPGVDFAGIDHWPVNT